MFHDILINAPTHPEFDDVVTGKVGGGDVNDGEKAGSALAEFVHCGLECHVSSRVSSHSV